MRALRQESKLYAVNITALAQSGRPASLYLFLDDSIGFFTWGAPSWQEAGEITGPVLAQARRILDCQGRPGCHAVHPLNS